MTVAAILAEARAASERSARVNRDAPEEGWGLGALYEAMRAARVRVIVARNEAMREARLQAQVDALLARAVQVLLTRAVQLLMERAREGAGRAWRPMCLRG